jgi:hypothetical protein
LWKQINHWLAITAAVFAAFVLIYVLTAPPIMNAIARQRGEASFPAVYQPIVRIIESEFNAPVLWYFNEVWHSEIILIGEPSISTSVIVTYAIVGVLLFAALTYPFLKRLRIRHVVADSAKLDI